MSIRSPRGLSSRSALLLTVTAALALLMAGCGGGSGGLDSPPAVGTASLSGTVYAPTAVVTAQAGGSGQPAANCPVEVVTEPGGQQIASGSTDDTGQYQFHGLQAGSTVMVQARLHSGDCLMSRVQLQDGSCQADVTGETTLAALCARYAYGQEDGPGAQERAGEVAEACLRYQAQNGHRYGEGEAGGPNFADEEEVQSAALGLLTATADAALERARTSRSEGDCVRAVEMIQAQLRARNENRLQWTEQIANQLAYALQQGPVSEERCAQVLSQVMNRQVTAEQVQHALRYMQQQLGIGEEGRQPEAVEVVAAMTMASGEGQMLRLQTQSQVQAMLQQMLGQ